MRPALLLMSLLSLVACSEEPLEAVPSPDQGGSDVETMSDLVVDDVPEPADDPGIRLEVLDTFGPLDLGEPDTGADVVPEDAPPPPPELTLEEVALYFAPIWYQDTANNGPDGQGPRGDLPTRVDYDGDLVHNNNWDNLPEAELRAWIYWGGVSTETHWLLSYNHYHPRDWEQLCTGLFTECHEGDMEYVQIVVRRTPDAETMGQVQIVRTHHHGQTTTWSEDGAVGAKTVQISAGGVDFEAEDGSVSDVQTAQHHRVRVFAEAKGHGIAPCKAGESLIKPYGILFLSCPDGAGTNFPGGDGLRLVPSAEEPPVFQPALAPLQGSSSYGLQAIENTLWAWRDLIGSGSLWREDTAFVYQGDRGGAFQTESPIGGKFDADQFINDDSSGRGPWDIEMPGSAHGDAFLDPAWAFSVALDFPEPFSLEYTEHAYLPKAVEAPASP